MKKININRIVTATGLLLGTFAIAMAAGSWQTPGSTPPGNNTDAPINTGAVDQAKTGGLTIGGAGKNLTVNGVTEANGGLIVQVCTGGSCPSTDAEDGRIWLVQ